MTDQKSMVRSKYEMLLLQPHVGGTNEICKMYVSVKNTVPSIL